MWILLMDLFSVLPQNTHIRGKFLKVDIMILYKPHKDVLFALEIKISLFLLKFSNVSLAVLHKLFICSFVKSSLWPMAIPRSFTSLLLFICLFSTINMMLLLFIDNPINVIWNLPGLATILLIRKPVWNNMCVVR